jgi:hypothetical protein
MRCKQPDAPRLISTSNSRAIGNDAPPPPAHGRSDQTVRLEGNDRFTSRRSLTPTRTVSRFATSGPSGSGVVRREPVLLTRRIVKPTARPRINRATICASPDPHWRRLARPTKTAANTLLSISLAPRARTTSHRARRKGIRGDRDYDEPNVSQHHTSLRVNTGGRHRCRA